MIKLKEILKEEKWEVKNDGDGYGKVTLNGKPVATWSYDEDSDSFWTLDVKTFRGEKSFDSRQEIIDYLKKNGAGKPGWNYGAYNFKKYESNIKEKLTIKEAKEIKLPTNFFLANFGKGGKYAICFARGGNSLSAKEIAKYGKMCEQLVDKYMDEFQIHSTSDDSYTFIYNNALIVCYYFYSEIKDPTEVVAKVDKAVHMF